MKRLARSIGLWTVALACLPSALVAQDLLLPDIIVRRSDLFDNRISTRVEPGRIHLTLTNGTANVGLGNLHLYGTRETNPDGTENVNQRIFRADGSFEDFPAGQFIYHPTHNHIHIEDWSIYRLREVLPGDGVGEIVAEGEKTSFCIVDLAVFDRDLPNFDSSADYRSCSSRVQGLTVGWIDIYDRQLEGQSIDITGLPEGRYWLESVVDPEDNIRELNEDNNVERIQVTVGDPNALQPDLFEPNNSIASVAERPPAGPNSPNLGPANPKRTVENLNLSVNDVDHFLFYANSIGGPLDAIRVDFDHSQGNVDLALLDASGEELARSTGDDDFEVISLEGRPSGWYAARVFSSSQDRNPNYRLAVNPPANEPPAISLVSPTEDTVLVHGSDSYTVEWHATDGEDNLMWVSLYLNTEPVDDGKQLATTSRNLEADLGSGVINSAEFEPGTYYVHAEVTDGGTTVGVWSTATVSFVEFGAECRTNSDRLDCNGNEIADSCELELGMLEDCDGNGIGDSCDMQSSPDRDRDRNGVLDACEFSFNRGDSNSDAMLDLADTLFILNFLFNSGRRPTCLESADVDNDGLIVVTDGVYLLSYLFTGGEAPPAPGPTDTACGPDSDDSFLGCDVYTGCD